MQGVYLITQSECFVNPVIVKIVAVFELVTYFEVNLFFDNKLLVADQYAAFGMVDLVIQHYILATGKIKGIEMLAHYFRIFSFEGSCCIHAHPNPSND
jgi:uncharacterized membrane protein